MEKRSEDDLGAVGHGKGHPQNEDELEDVVEGCESQYPNSQGKWSFRSHTEPVDSIDHALKNGEEGIDDPVLFKKSILSMTSSSFREDRKHLPSTIGCHQLWWW